MAYTKLLQAIDDDECDPLEQTFQEIILYYGIQSGRKVELPQNSWKDFDFPWKTNPADELGLTLRETQIFLKEIKDNRPLTNILKKHPGTTMSLTKYIQAAEMTISKMILQIPEM